MNRQKTTCHTEEDNEDGKKGNRFRKGVGRRRRQQQQQQEACAAGEGLDR